MYIYIHTYMRILINDKNAVYILSSESRCENKMYFYSTMFLEFAIHLSCVEFL